MSKDSARLLRVFLCHASIDKPKVLSLYYKLVNDGVDAWLDKEKLIPGQNWQIEIPKAVRNSDVVIVCLSSNSINKDGFVQKEIKIALDAADEKPEGTIFIIPARLENCEVPERISQYHWVDLFSPDGYERLFKALQERVNNIGIHLNKKTSSSHLDHYSDSFSSSDDLRQETSIEGTYVLNILFKPITIQDPKNLSKSIAISPPPHNESFTFHIDGRVAFHSDSNNRFYERKFLNGLLGLNIDEYGSYYLYGDHIKIKIATSKGAVDYEGTYSADKLVLDVFSHMNGQKANSITYTRSFGVNFPTLR